MNDTIKNIKSIDDLRSAACDSGEYTDEQLRAVLVDGLRKKAFRRGLRSGLISGVLLGCFITWILL